MEGLLHDQSSLWQQKGKDQFVVEVDRNSAYFHALHKFKQSSNMLVELNTEEGGKLYRQEDIQ
ncbi:hypothetical protein FRX31_019118, partial [Thalictrum thalictroides]